MRLSVKFNNQELNTLINVTNGFNPFAGADWSPQTHNAEAYNGSKFISTSTNEKTITMPFVMRGDIKTKYAKLQAILNVSEPQQLIFGNMRDRYFNAIPTGTINLLETGTDFSASGTITWLVPDGVAIALEPSKVNATTVNGILTANINVDCSAEVYPIYRIKNTNENAYVGIAQKNGAFAMGNIVEADKTPAEKSVVLWKGGGSDFNSWANGTTMYQDLNKKVVTTMTADSNGLGITPDGYTGTGDMIGALKEYVLTTPAQHWYIWAKAWFETGIMGQTGQWVLSAIDENGVCIASMIIDKSDATGNRASVFFQVWDGTKMVNRERIFFQPAYWVSYNPYGSESKNNNRNMFDMRKENDKVTFFFAGKYYPFSHNAIKNLKLKRIQFYTGQFKGYDTGAKKVTHTRLTYLSITQNNIPYMKDVPNRYFAGSDIEINCEDTSVKLNGLPADRERIGGSVFAPLSVGTNTIEFYPSNWSTGMEVEIEYYKRWS